MFSSCHCLLMLIWHLISTSQSQATSVVRQAFIDLSNLGLEFSPTDEQALLLFESNANTIAICARICYSHALYRTFNFNSQSKRCRLYEGDMDSTGSVIASDSSQSLVGSIKMTVEDFTNQGRPCSFCEDSRYLTCVYSTCQCQPHTFFNGSICRSQQLIGANCTSDVHCRIDINLTCLSNTECGYKYNLTFNLSSEHTTDGTYTTNTTYISSSSSSTSTSISTTATTSITSTTTTPFHCNSTCVNQTWSSSLNLLTQWLFDGSFGDQTNNYNLTPSTNISFTTNGYVKQAIVFTPGASQMLTTSYMPLSNSSFAVDTWLYITQLLNISDHSIFGLCPVAVSHQCLHLTIRYNNPNYYLYLGFYAGDCEGITPLKLNTWIHAGFVFDFTTLTQKIYLNGILENSCNTSLAIISTGNITVGYIPAIATTSPNNYFRGYIYVDNIC